MYVFVDKPSWLLLLIYIYMCIYIYVYIYIYDKLVEYSKEWVIILQE